MRGRFALQVLSILFVVTPMVFADDAADQFFERKIRPVLVEHCYKCHSEESKKDRGGLLVDSKDGLVKGGDSALSGTHSSKPGSHFVNLDLIAFVPEEPASKSIPTRPKSCRLASATKAFPGPTSISTDPIESVPSAMAPIAWIPPRT